MYNMQTIHLRAGDHPDNAREKCAMEAVAFLAGEKHTDCPACVSGSIGSFVRPCNDWFTQAERDEYLLPMLWDFIGTATDDKAVEGQRTYIVADYAVRVFAPIALDAVGKSDAANVLRNLEKIVDRRTALSARDKAAPYATDTVAVASASSTAFYASYATSYAVYAVVASLYAANTAFHAADGASRKQVVEACISCIRDMLAVGSRTVVENVRTAEELACAME